MKKTLIFILLLSFLMLFSCSSIQSLQPSELEQIIYQKYKYAKKDIKQIDILISDQTVIDLSQVPFIEDILDSHEKSEAEPADLMVYMAYAIDNNKEKLFFYQRYFSKGIDSSNMVEMIDYHLVLPISLKTMESIDPTDKIDFLNTTFIKLSFSYNDSNEYFDQYVKNNSEYDNSLKYYILFDYNDEVYCLIVIDNSFIIINEQTKEEIYTNLVK
ncbi:hypothetical protein LJC17_04660 [Acholeplasma sp. OttesenSCG-928-E16]|nr:hypothetical protein [Acholeplasma sp. OttesenSCG-928-E16]